MAGKMGKFPRCSDFRNRAGLDLTTLTARLGAPGPKERSIRRLESGHSIRLAGVYRIAHEINSELRERGLELIEFDKEIIVDK